MRAPLSLAEPDPPYTECSAPQQGADYSGKQGQTTFSVAPECFYRGPWSWVTVIRRAVWRVQEDRGERANRYVQALLELGLLEKDEGGGLRAPFDEIVIRAGLRKAA